MNKARIGVLCYDLSPASLSFFHKVSPPSKHYDIKAYPIFRSVHSNNLGFDHLESSLLPRTVYLNNSRGSSPENQIRTLGLSIVRKLVHSSDIVVLLGLQGIPALITALLSALYRKPVITIVQTMKPAAEQNRPFIIRFMKRFILRLAWHNIAQTPNTTETLTTVYRIRKERITYVGYDGGAQQFFRVLQNISGDVRASTRETLGLASDAKIILFAGTLFYLKGVDVLIRAFAKFNREHPDYILMVVGPNGDKSGELSNLMALATAMNVDSRVKFTGELDWGKLSEIYASADIFVLPTRKDTWGKVLVEAGLAGLPIITTEVCGGAGYLVQEGINGFIVPVDSVDALAASLEKLSDPQLRNNMGRESKRIMINYLDSSREQQLYDEVLQKCVLSLKMN